MAFETDIRVRINSKMKAYFRGLACEVSTEVNNDVTFSDIVRDYLEEGIDTGRLKGFALERYSGNHHKSEAA